MINNAPDDVLACDLEEYFNIDQYIKMLALDVILGNWDGYSFNQNNFYLYEDPLTGQVQYLMYDLDNTLGIDYFGVDWAQRDPYSWSPGQGDRPLYDVVMDVPVFRDAYSQYLNDYYDLFYIQGWFTDRANEIHELIGPHMLLDTYYPLDYGFSYEDFENSLEESIPDHVNYGILEYTEERFNSLNAQIEAFTEAPLIDEYIDNSPIIDEDVEISVHINGEVTGVQLLYDFDGGSSSSLEFTEQSDSWWNVSLSPEAGADRINYNIIAQNNNTNTTYRCEDEFLWLSAANTGLYINEIAPNNASIISDENGAFADYVELFVDFDDIINLGSVFMTDDFDEPWKWDIPAVTLEGGDYHIIWTDSDPEEGPFHAPFNMNATGDRIALFRMEGGKWRVLDYHEFGSTAEDLTESRGCNDQIDLWLPDHEATPLLSNCTVNIEEDSNNDIIAYPNPGKGLFKFSQAISAQVFDARGRLVDSLNQQPYLDLRGMENGLYIVISSKGKQFKLLKY